MIVVKWSKKKPGKPCNSNDTVRDSSTFFCRQGKTNLHQFVNLNHCAGEAS